MARVGTDTLLTHTGPGTPCGDYLRRHWQPFLLANELSDLPIAVRLLGEDLVVYRDRSGDMGLLARNCLHRGASLEFGIPQTHGIRCCYHGWLFGNDGTLLETPAEPPNSPIRHKYRQTAYAVRELHGMLFAYMGPPEFMPELPLLDSMNCVPDNRPVPFRFDMPCNWLQVVENACDPIHNAYLHAIVSNLQFAASFTVLPALDFVETPLGFLSMATRRVKQYVFARASDIILPNIGQFTGAANNADEESFRIGCGRTRWVVPIDDTNCQYIGFVHFNDTHKPYGNLREDDLGVGKAGFIGQTADRPYHERQREPGDYDAVASQGGIADRGAEHLGTTDRGVVLFRRMLAREIRALKEGRTTPIAEEWAKGGPATTYVHEYALPIPEGMTLASHEELRAFGRNAAEHVIKAGRKASGEARERIALSNIRQMFTEEPA